MKVIAILTIGVVVIILCVRYIERTSLFYPEKELPETPRSIGLPFEDINFKSANTYSLNGWFIPAEGADTTILFLHGNAGNIADRLGKILFFHKMRVNVFIIDYRGFGKSEGHPSEKGMYEDAQAAYQYLITRDDVQKDKIVIYGASLGGVAAVDLACHVKVRGIILDSTFTNAKDMAKEIYPFIPSFLISLELDSLTKIKELTVPKLFIHSIYDETVPFRLGKQLYDAAAEPKRFIEIGGSHNDGHVLDEDKFVSGIKEFIRNEI